MPAGPPSPEPRPAAGPAAFSERLMQTARHQGLPLRPTAFARWFNARSGERPVTVHAVRKWLVGEACPTQARILRLSQLLAVDPTWLRFGTRGEAAGAPAVEPPPAADMATMEALMAQLPRREQLLLMQLVRGLVDARAPE